MNRKLLALDIVLGAGVIYGGILLHNEWLAAKERQARMPGPAPKAPIVAPLSPLAQEQAVMPSGYKDVAMKDLFDVSRNPDIPVDPVVPPKPEPPPVPPPLPAYRGMMDFGDPQGPLAQMIPADGQGHEEIHAGEMIGAFKLLSFNRQEMIVEWNGQQIHARLNESSSQAAKPRASAAEPITTNGIVPGQAPKADAYVPPQPQKELGPGSDLGEGVKSCQAGDSSPDGAVSGNYKKEVHLSPMGVQCQWRTVGK